MSHNIILECVFIMVMDWNGFNNIISSIFCIPIDPHSLLGTLDLSMANYKFIGFSLLYHILWDAIMLIGS